ncbi:hypothetical protein [Ruegeria arenilitoris]|uniref:hypothetical protein n=1 Tax=Ruegeria arenilitoris TaxID=1173585 RepID=UPI00147E12CD|nr:hypothetical protein [Ruegeria arenilitoris]
MATKAELEAELADLREKLNERDDQEELSVTSPQSDNDAEENSSLSKELSDFGINGESIEEVFRQLVHELDDFHKQKPVLTVAAAFALGFLLGRSSK